jgi:Fe2+ transport system protein FeoA
MGQKMSNKNKYLIDMKEGEKGTIISICGGQMATKRLMDLGLVPETRIKILKKALFEGPVEIEFRGSKLVIGRGLAAKILVESI